MNDLASQPTSNSRFRIFRWFVAIAIVLILAMVGWNLSKTYSSAQLSESVAKFNEKAKADRVGKHEPPVTEDEIVKSIESQLPTLDATSQVKSMFAQIAESQQLPPGASLSWTSGWEPRTGEHRTVWWVNLSVMTGANTGYELRIRQTDNPVVAEGKNPLMK